MLKHCRIFVRESVRFLDETEINDNNYYINISECIRGSKSNAEILVNYK